MKFYYDALTSHFFSRSTLSSNAFHFKPLTQGIFPFALCMYFISFAVGCVLKRLIVYDYIDQPSIMYDYIDQPDMSSRRFIKNGCFRRSKLINELTRKYLVPRLYIKLYIIKLINY